MKICGQCGVEFQPATSQQKYHSRECASAANLRKTNERDRTRYALHDVPTTRDRTRERAEYRTYTPPVQPAQLRVPVLRAGTLAETPDVPAEAAARGDMLTGKAGACCTAGRVVHASGGGE